MWIDTHAHLYDCNDAHLDELVSAAVRAGVGAVVSTATSLENAPITISQAERSAHVWSAVGVSPFDVEHVSPSWADELAALCASDKVLAVGEIGIDGTNPSYPAMDIQVPVFELQLEVAKNCAIPAVIHSRGMEVEALEICRRKGVADAVFHCFTGTREALLRIIENGYYVSLSGIITFKNFALREYIRDIPPEQLLIETDCPYLAPVPHRGQPNQPAWVRYVGEEIARLRGVAADELEMQIEKNFRNLFRKFSDRSVFAD